MPQLKDVEVGHPFYRDPDGVGVCTEILVRNPGEEYSANVFRIGGVKNGNLVLIPTGERKSFDNPGISVVKFSLA